MMACRVICMSAVRSCTSKLLVSSLRRQTPASVYRVTDTNRCSHIPVRCSLLHTSSCYRKSFNVQDSEDFTERVIKSDVPTIVDFHATWCAPCKILGPRLEKVIGEKEGKVQLAKVDIDDNTDLAMEYGVSAVPTVIAMKNGEKVNEFIGVQEDDQLKSFVDGLL
ncbi:thioredoxin, mitochondrial-like [Ptychodera flava]|uniref:thioredoxin, mitochondrial-like n=1 Tax=Ptychodera flava TaxID=63121 RepID=UPI003969D79D